MTEGPPIGVNQGYTTLVSGSQIQVEAEKQF